MEHHEKHGKVIIASTSEVMTPGEYQRQKKAFIIDGTGERHDKMTPKEILDFQHGDNTRQPYLHLLNDKTLHDTSKEAEGVVDKMDQAGELPAGHKAPSPEELRDIQNFVFQFKKKHQLANEARIIKAVELHFNKKILLT